MCYSRSEIHLATGSLDENVRIWFGNSSHDSFAIDLQEGVNSIASSYSFDRILAGSGKNSLTLFDSKVLSKLLNLSTSNLSQIYSVSLSFDGVLALSGEESGSFSLFDTRSGNIANQINLQSPVKSTAFRENGSAVACGCENGVIVLWDTRTKSIIEDSQLHDQSVNSLDFHPTKPLLLTGSSDSTVSVCNANDRKILFTLKHHQGSVRGVRWSADGNTFTSCGDYRKVVLWSEPKN